MGYEEEEKRNININAWSPSLTVHHTRNCLCACAALGGRRCPDYRQARSVDQAQAQAFRLQVRVQYATVRFWCVLTRASKRLSSGRARPMFRRKRPPWGRGIDRLVFLEHASRLLGVWF